MDLIYRTTKLATESFVGLNVPDSEFIHVQPYESPELRSPARYIDAAHGRSWTARTEIYLGAPLLSPPPL